MPERTCSLDGVTVLDLTDEAGVFGARLLADLGAEVIRVEPLGGDALRHRPPFLHGAPGPERSLSHLLYNAGKRSVALDLRHADAWRTIDRLALAADVVLAPLAKDEPARAFLDRMHGTDERPPVVDLVFRRDAPHEVATDIVATAAGGLLVLNGFPDDPPNHPAGELAYKQASLAAAEAALALILERDRTGQRGWATVSLQEAVNWTTLQTANANAWHWHGLSPTRHAPIAPGTTFRSADGRWTSFTIHPPNWPRFVDWIAAQLGVDELTGPEWDDLAYRAAQRGRVVELTAQLCAALPQRELIDEGQARGLLVLPVNGVADLAADPHLLARDFYVDVPHPALSATLTLPRSPFRSSAFQAPARPAPTLGQHTREVLAALEIEPFVRSEVEVRTAASTPRQAHEPVHPPERPEPAASVRPEPVEGANGTPPGSDSAPQPLEGIRILDFCWAIAGPLGTRLLADLGADVIKVESEYRLDPIRYIGVMPEGHRSWNFNGQFHDCNPNKRSLVLNLNTPQGLDIARRLAATADVVTSNYTPDRLDKWGLGYDALRRINPNIIVANLAVMGIHGPHKGWRSYGSGIVAMCGLAALTGFPGRDPIGLGTLHTDFTVPYFAAIHILGALHHRRRTGEGQYLELSQYESSIHLLDTELVEHLNPAGRPDPASLAGRAGHPEPGLRSVEGRAAQPRVEGRIGPPTPLETEPFVLSEVEVRTTDQTNVSPDPRTGNRSPYLAPHGVFPAAGDDQWLALACRHDTDWRNLCAAIGRPDLHPLDRWSQQDQIESAIAAWTAQHDPWHAARLLQAAGIPASPVQQLRDLLTRDTAMRDDYRAVPLPDGLSALVQEEPVLWDGARLPIRRAPDWGEHTQSILRDELGLDDDAIAQLAADHVLY